MVIQLETQRHLYEVTLADNETPLSILNLNFIMVKEGEEEVE